MISLGSRLGVLLSETPCGEERYYCPFCIDRVGKPDLKGKLYVNIRKNKFWCHKCSFGGTVDLLKKKLLFEDRSLDLPDLMDEINAILAPKVPITQNIEKKLPADYTKLFKGTEAYKYIIDRGVKEEWIDYYDIGFGTEYISKLPKDERKHYSGQGRVIFPDFDFDGGVCYWVARTYKDHMNKYKNAPYESRDQIFNLGRTKRQDIDSLVIVEGPLDCIVASQYLPDNIGIIAAYGKAVTYDQIYRLCNEIDVNTYYIALDPDANKDCTKLFNELYSKGKEDIRIVCMPADEDPASLGDKFLDHLDEARCFSQTFCLYF